jgi:hypothetical protein
MNGLRAVGLAVLIFTASLHPAFATLLIDFSAAPPAIHVGQSTTLRLLLTPVFDRPADEFNRAGSSQTVERSALGKRRPPAFP